MVHRSCAALATLLTAFSLEPTRAGQLAMMNGLLKAWTDTSAMLTTAQDSIPTPDTIVNGAAPVTLGYARIAAGYSAPNSPVGAGNTPLEVIYQPRTCHIAFLNRYNGKVSGRCETRQISRR